MANTVVSYETKAAAKRAEGFAKISSQWRLRAEYLTGDETIPTNIPDIPAKCGILTPAELDITELNATDIAKNVQSGALKAEHVAIAFSKRAAIAQQLTSCLTEIFFEDGIKRGQYLDTYLGEHGKLLGPLHGVPVSIKECFNYKGVQTSIGIMTFLDRPFATENAPIAESY